MGWWAFLESQLQLRRRRPQLTVHDGPIPTSSSLAQQARPTTCTHHGDARAVGPRGPVHGAPCRRGVVAVGARQLRKTQEGGGHEREEGSNAVSSAPGARRHITGIAPRWRVGRLPSATLVPQASAPRVASMPAPLARWRRAHAPNRAATHRPCVDAGRNPACRVTGVTGDSPPRCHGRAVHIDECGGRGQLQDLAWGGGGGEGGTWCVSSALRELQWGDECGPAVTAWPRLVADHMPSLPSADARWWHCPTLARCRKLNSPAAAP
jgi:hypothetical protein